MKIHKTGLTQPLVHASLTLALVSLIGCGGSSGGSKASSSSSVIASVASSVVEESSSSENSVEASSSSLDASSIGADSSSSSLDEASSSSVGVSSSSEASSSSQSSVIVVVPSSSSVEASSSSSEESSSESSSSSEASSSSIEASSSSLSSSSSSIASSTAWTLIWKDEFEGAEIDSTKWGHEVNCWGGGNNEAQCYTASPDNSYVAGGFLHIVAKYEGAGQSCGPALNQEDPGYPGATICKDYSSARLRTRDKGDWTYGRMEIRAKMPEGVGIWPAIWMLPTDTTKYGGWPHSGEIDIFEAFQPGISGGAPTGEANEIHGTLHYGYSWPINQYSGASYEPPANIWDEFHTYAVEWEEGEIRWYVDNVLFARNSGNWFIYYWGGQEVGYQVGTGAQPFDQPFHMILNVALGNGSYVPWPTFTDDTKAMEVDYVRVYECSANPVTGKGCETPTANPGVIPTLIAKDTPPPATWDTRWLYKDGLQTMEFNINNATVQQSLTLGNYACPTWESWCPDDSGITVTEPNITDGPGGETAKVLDLEFAGISNAFIIVGDALSDDALNFGGSIGEYGRAANLGEIKFDLRVLDIDPNTKLLIKLDSGYPNNSYHEIEIPAENVWTEVSVRLYSLLPNTNEGYASPVDFKSIKNPFVIEPVGGNAHVQLNNIRIVCQDSEEWGNCDIKPKEAPVNLTETFSILTNGAVDPLWDFGLGTWDNDSGSVTTSYVLDVDRGHNVLQVNFSGNQNGLAFIQSTSGRDVSAFAVDGQFVFDIKVLSYGSNTSGLVVKMESGPATGTGDWIISPAPAVGVWTTVRLDIADMIAHAGTSGAFNINTVNSPFVFLPTWDNQSGVQVQFDNIRWELPEL